MLRELCLRSGVLVPPELMQSSSSLANSASMQVGGRTNLLPPLSIAGTNNVPFVAGE